jgi:hypothetical protein
MEQLADNGNGNYAYVDDIDCFCQSKPRPFAHENRAHLGLKRTIARIETAPS